MADLDGWLAYVAATAYAAPVGAAHSQLLALAEAARTRIGYTYAVYSGWR